MRLGRLLVLLTLAAFPRPASPSPTSAADLWVPEQEREVAPKLLLRDLEGKKRQLTRLEGQVVVVNFWATWCGPCRLEMPEFAKLHADFADQGVQVIGAANEPRSSRDQVREFVDRLEIRFSIWLEASLDHMEAFGVGPELPATVIVDQRGRIAARIQGVTDEARLRGLVERILLEAAPPP